MRRRRIAFFLSFTVSLLAVCFGCAAPAAPAVPVVPVIVADSPVTIDGVAAEPFWRQAPALSLLVPADRSPSPACVQGGRVKFARDDRFLYLLAEITDDDVVQVGSDHGNLYETGDVVELFLAPVGRGRYWEILLGSNGSASVLFFPGPGRKIFASAIQHDVRVETAVQVDGTADDWHDQDRGFTLEAAIPLAELTRFGDRFESGRWQLLVGRYNYSVTLPELEYSASSRLPRTNFHLREYYGTLSFPETSPLTQP